MNDQYPAGLRPSLAKSLLVGTLAGNLPICGSIRGLPASNAQQFRCVAANSLRGGAGNSFGRGREIMAGGQGIIRRRRELLFSIGFPGRRDRRAATNVRAKAAIYTTAQHSELTRRDDKLQLKQCRPQNRGFSKRCGLAGGVILPV